MLKEKYRQDKNKPYSIFIVSATGALLYVNNSSSFQNITDVKYIVFSLCVLAWIVALTNREFEFNWWKGSPAVFGASIISILFSMLRLPCFQLFLKALIF